MIEPLDEANAPGIPRDLLPPATAPAGAPEWRLRRERIMTLAEPMLRELAAPAAQADTEWTLALGSWWKPAAMLAAAAAALLLLVDPRATQRSAAQDALSLNIVATQGEPFALWEGFGIDADPVLALLVMQEQSP